MEKTLPREARTMTEIVEERIGRSAQSTCMDCGVDTEGRSYCPAHDPCPESRSPDF